MFARPCRSRANNPLRSCENLEVVQALTRAADRAVKVRIYLDGTQLAQREPTEVFNDLAETPGV
jgi:hypothetical protein